MFILFGVEKNSFSGHQQAFDDTITQLVLDPVLNNTNSSSIHFDQNNNEEEDSPMVNQLKQSSAGFCPEAFDVPSTSGQNCVSEECSSDCLLAYSQLHASSERNPEISASDGEIPLHNDGSPHVTLRSSYSVNLDSLDDVIADEYNKKVIILSSPQVKKNYNW